MTLQQLMYAIMAADEKSINKTAQKYYVSQPAISDAIKDLEEEMSSDEIIGVNIPTAVPLVYEFDDDFKVIRHYYLGDQEALKAKMEAVANQGKAK